MVTRLQGGKLLWLVALTWTDNSGAFTLVAELVAVQGDKVVLRRQNGKQITVPLAEISAKDQQRAWANHLGIPVQITNSLGMKLNLIPPGEFTMGSPELELGRRHDETQHLVKSTQPFYLSVNEVTQQQYTRVMVNNPSKSKDMNKPVENVNWNDAVEFCRELTKEEGVEYRLPTEAQWEYACRAGTTTAYSFGNDVAQLGEYAWYDGNSESTTHPVGELKPNAWDLYDMQGNVFEWCQDWYGPYKSLNVVSNPTGAATGNFCVLRGRAFYYLPKLVRAAFRTSNQPGNRNHTIGFRVARTIPLSR